jgi:hypothetical protein
MIKRVKAMQRLFPRELLTIVTADTLEGRLLESVRNCGASGYITVKAPINAGEDPAASVSDVAVVSPERFEQPLVVTVTH